MRVKPFILFSARRYGSTGTVKKPFGIDNASVPILVWDEGNFPCTKIKKQPTKEISKVTLPRHQSCMLKKNDYIRAKLAEKGAQIFHQLLGFNHVPDNALACSPQKLKKAQCSDIFILQDYIKGLTVEEGLKSPDWNNFIHQALDNPKNLFPLYLQMVIGGDSDRHKENMIVDTKGKLWTIDYELSGGHDFYMYPGYESFTTPPELEERFARRTPFSKATRTKLGNFIKNWKENQDKLSPYYAYRQLQGFLERARILQELGKLIPTDSLFPMIRGTFYPH
ncbi:MAG: hypothetical protein K2X66_02880 [Cyanobacteria bacterium]|nr:hypothetical protein [Cyanobacteriota bacterium]